MTNNEVSDDLIGRVKFAMRGADISQAELAERINLTPDKVSKSLNGVRSFSSLELALISESTGITVGWLLGIDDDVIRELQGRVRALEAAARPASAATVESDQREALAEILFKIHEPENVSDWAEFKASGYRVIRAIVANAYDEADVILAAGYRLSPPPTGEGDRKAGIREALLWLDGRLDAEELDMCAEHFDVDIEWATTDEKEDKS